MCLYVSLRTDEKFVCMYYMILWVLFYYNTILDNFLYFYECLFLLNDSTEAYHTFIFIAILFDGDCIKKKMKNGFRNPFGFCVF